ncbi:MAG: tRNA lysidine(34) synthetase TilS, partial [Chitinophagaceae bacterium]|nr:tRNA lysidine(34) synthetase TilS [Chitinophagaceae bacterium]
SHRVIRDREFLIITVFDTRQTDLVTIDKIPTTFMVDGRQYKFQYKSFEGSVPADENIAYINTAKLEQPLILRRWRQGDYLYPLGMGMKKKKVSRYLIDKKVPVHEKEHIWVLESNRRIVWVAGHRLDERFKVTPLTTEVLIVKRS